MAERVTIFIDWQNLWRGLIDEFDNTKLDFVKFATKLVDDRQLVRVYYYTALPDQARDPEQYAKQQRFLDALREKPYFDVRLGRLVPRGDSYVEKGVDIALAVDMLEMAYSDSYNTAILVSGDGDLARVVACRRADSVPGGDGERTSLGSLGARLSVGETTHAGGAVQGGEVWHADLRRCGAYHFAGRTEGTRFRHREPEG